MSDGEGWLLLVVAVIFVGLLFLFAGQYEKCDDRGGVLMRDVFGMYHCMDKELP